MHLISRRRNDYYTGIYIFINLSFKRFKNTVRLYFPYLFYLVAELHHFRDDLLADVWKDGVTNKLHIFNGELVHIYLQATN